MASCEVCFRHCELDEGRTGFCGVRTCRDGRVCPDNYGKITSLALDPIEKKPLRRFHPGSMILSAGSFGCNLRCPFCQNHEISWGMSRRRINDDTEYISPETLAQTAQYYADRGNIGVAYTYNEPLIGYEYVRDTARLVHDMGMVNVMVTNGAAQLWVLEELTPFIDAMNIDLKGFTDEYYRDLLHGDLRMVKDFIRDAVRKCHVELTTLIIPDENDSEQEMRRMCEWIRELSPSVPLHISRFFPRFRMTDRPATSVRKIYELADTAREYLEYVYTGNC